MQLKNIFKTLFFLLNFSVHVYGTNNIGGSPQDTMIYAYSLEEALQHPLRVDKLLLEGYSHFPKEVLKLDNLEMIFLKESNINEFPEGISDLKKLYEIVFENVAVFPLGINRIPNLTNLVFDECSFKIPYNFNVRTIQLFGKVPGGLENIKNTRLLIISHTRAENLDFLCAFQELQGIHISDIGPVAKLPDCIINLKNLEDFRVDMMNISSLPDKIGELQKLKAFHLYQTNVEELPESFFNLTQLQDISISKNKISEEQKQKARKFVEWNQMKMD